MLKLFKNKSDFHITVILEGVVGLIAIGLSFIGFIFKTYGWTIGVTSGVIISMLSTIMVLKGSDAAMKNNKTGLYLLFYFFRMILFVATLFTFGILQFKLKIDAFNYSIWGVLLGYTPMFLILIIGQVKGLHDLNIKIEKKNEEK